MRVFVGFLLGVVACIVGPLLALRLGLVDMSAVPAPSAVERAVGELAFDGWLAHTAPTSPNPFPSDPANIAVGMDHYRENCVDCHGGPGVTPAELAKGLHPDAPKLWKTGSQSMTDGELFWTIRNGVRMTGMPAFAPTHTDKEIWQIVTFVRHLPQLTADERATLQAATEEGDHHAP
jgi:mono/diheme cytochrome c family protein